MRRLDARRRLPAGAGFAARLLGAACIASAPLWATTALAQLTVAAPPVSGNSSSSTSNTSTAQVGVAEETRYTTPNRPILVGGIVGLVGAYVPSVIVAASSSKPYDNDLYIPLVGPWISLVSRPSCTDAVVTRPCSTENGYKALLVVGGVFQSLGAIAIVLGLVVPEKHTARVTEGATTPRKLRVQVFPSAVGNNGYGVTAAGNF